VHARVPEFFSAGRVNCLLMAVGFVVVVIVWTGASITGYVTAQIAARCGRREIPGVGQFLLRRRRIARARMQAEVFRLCLRSALSCH
jgi:hypothetical protein